MREVCLNVRWPVPLLISTAEDLQNTNFLYLLCHQLCHLHPFHPDSVHCSTADLIQSSVQPTSLSLELGYPQVAILGHKSQRCRKTELLNFFTDFNHMCQQCKYSSSCRLSFLYIYILLITDCPNIEV